MSSSSSSTSDSEGSSAEISHSRKRPRLSEDISRDESSSASDTEDSDDESSQSDADSEEKDAPVLSHAEKRKKRKKEQLATHAPAPAIIDRAGGKGKDTVTNTADLPPSKVPKRQNSIWVGNLSFKTTPASLRTFFEGVGEITRIHMPTKIAAGGPEAKGPRKENRGFAYVDFTTPDAKLVAISLSENHLDGRRLLIKDGDDFKGRPTATLTSGADGTDPTAAPQAAGRTKTAQRILSAQKQPPGPTLFLGNLGFETTADAIRALLESHRVKAPPSEDATDSSEKWIRKVRLGTFEDSGKCKGWAFVDFTHPEHATAALTNPRNHHLNGRKLVVEYASPDAVRRGGGGPPRTDRKDKETHGGQDNERDREKGRSAKRERPGRRERGVDESKGTVSAGEAGPDADVECEQGPPVKKRRADEERGSTGGRGRGSSSRRDFAGRGARTRVRPGAALALAKREDVGIVPSQGTKIVF